MSTPLSSSWRTPAIPASGGDPAANSASEPSSTSVSGLRNSSQGASQSRRPGCTRGRSRGSPCDRPPAGNPARRARARTRSRRCLRRRGRATAPARARAAREAARQPALLVVRDDDHREIVHGGTVASGRGRDSALPRRAAGGQDARPRTRAGRAAAAPADALRGRQAAKVQATKLLAPVERRRARRLGQASPLRLHLGSGGHELPGWVNVDLVGMGSDRWNTTSRLPFPDGSADAAFLEHVLERFPLETVLAMLAESRRVLTPRGILRAGVPDFGRYAESYAATALSSTSAAPAGRRRCSRSRRSPRPRPSLGLGRRDPGARARRVRARRRPPPGLR